MKKYYVTVNGNRYEVEVEEVKGDFAANNSIAVSAETSKLQAQPSVAAQPAPVPAPAPAPAPIQNVSTDGEKMECPMPGTILKVNINPGDTFKKGDVLFILEAMKMENEIMAPRDGKVLQVGVQKGAAVNTGDILAVIQ